MMGMDHVFFLSSFGTKLEDLIRVLKLEQPDSALIFCNTKTDAFYVSRGLTRRSYSVGLVSEDMPRSDRNRIISSIKSGKLRFLIMTGGAFDGIDVRGISHVIYFDLPEASDIYTSQTETLARKANPDAVFSLISGQDINVVAAIRGIEGLEIEERNIPTMEEISDMEETRMIKDIQNSMEGFDPSEYISVAQKLMELANREETVAFLLNSYFEKKHSPAGAPKRQQPAHALSKRPVKQERRETPDKKPKTSKLENGVKIFLSAGRKDRCNTGKIIEMLQKEADIPAEKVGAIVVKDTYSFIEVSEDKVENIIGLSGVKAFGKELRVEVAKAK